MDSLTKVYLLSSEIPFVVFSFILFPILIILSIKKVHIKNIRDSKEIYGINDTLQFRGIAAVVVMIHHYSLKMSPSGKMFYYWFVGYLAVGVFFCISGYSAYIQMQKKGDKFFDGYFIKRFSRLLIPYFIINTICAIMYRVPLKDYFYGMFTLQIMRGPASEWEVIWFFVAMLYFTIAYYFAFKLIKTKRPILIFGICSAAYFIVNIIIHTNQRHWYNTAFAYLVGIIFAKYKDKIIDMLHKHSKVYLIVLGIIDVILFLVITKVDNIILSMACEMILIVITILISMHIEFKKGLFTIIGNMSWELFLIHSWIPPLFFEIDKVESGYLILVMAVISILVSFVINKLSTICINMVSKIKLKCAK